MRTFKPDDILNNKQPKSTYKKIELNSSVRKTFFLGITFLTVVVFLFNFISVSKAKNAQPKLAGVSADKIIHKVYGIAISIDGETKVVLDNTATANEVIKSLKIANLPTDENLKIKKAYFKEKVELKGTWVNKEQILDAKTAINNLLFGNVKVQKYVVKEGDNLWSIARKHDMRVKEILAANPNIDADTQLISIDQEIFLKKPQPQVTMVAVLKGKRKKTIPYETKIVKDTKLDRGKEKVMTEGKDGLRIFSYEVTTVNGTVTDKKILSDYIEEKPVTKVVAAGSARRAKLVLASRSGDGDGGGNGNYMWPTRGSITSGFGYRGSEFHTGLDIDGDTGDPVVASDSGTVIESGWGGGYGKNVVIDHGNGVVTRYAHLSSYTVSEGENVGRGEYIGSVGSTGRSTGSHLHFEVIVNGVQKSPLRYLN